MTNNVKVSIIVPVYNVEGYVSRCIDSLLSQTLKEIEIIIVDDGSTDNSGKICDAYAEQFSNIKVFHQSNYGLTCARRVGLEKCSGEYILFVDSDDWVDKNMCEREYGYAKKCNAKILICDYKVVKGQSVEVKKGYFDDEISIEKYYLRLTPGYVWNKLYHHSLVDNMKVSINVSQAEDICMLLPLVSFLNSDSDIAYLNESFYYYFQREYSSSNSDFFVESNAIGEYLSAIRYILDNHNKKYSDLVSFYCMQCMFWGINNPARACFKADYIEFIQKTLFKYIVGNQYMSKFPAVYSELIRVLLPKNLVYSSVGGQIYDVAQQRCIDSWKFYASDYNLVCLDESNIDFNSMPKCVLKAYEEKEYTFVEEYLGLKYIYQNGGIYISANIKLNKSLGEQRLNKAFFGYVSLNQIGASIWGSLSSNPLLKAVLDTYEVESIYNDSFLGLAERMQLELENNYKLIPKGKETFLMNGLVKLYSRESLYEYAGTLSVSQMYDMNDEKAFCASRALVSKEWLKNIIDSIKKNGENLSAIQRELEKKEKNILELKSKEKVIAQNYEKQMIELRRDIGAKENIEMEKIRAQINALINDNKKLNEQLVQEKNNGELNKQAYDNVINSTAWKITAPIRKMIDWLKKLLKK